jgi:hypothetical protein
MAGGTAAGEAAVSNYTHQCHIRIAAWFNHYYLLTFSPQNTGHVWMIDVGVSGSGSF